jgi:hypothetical protein
MEQKNKPYSRIACFGNDTKNIFLKTAIIIIELKYYYKEVISVSKYILENYLIGQSIGVKLYLREIDTFYEERPIKEVSKSSKIFEKEIHTKLIEIQETQERIKQDQDRLIKIILNSQHKDMHQWGINLSLERLSEMNLRFVNLIKLLNYVKENVKE